MSKSGVSYMLMGEFNNNIDEKSRLVIPSKLRQEIGNDIILTRGLENCLFIYSKQNFDNITSQLNQLPFTKKDARNFSRFFLSGASLTTYDKQGRILIPAPLIKYANIKKECIIIGVGNRIEIWSKDNWEKFFNESSEELSDIAENLFDSVG